MRFIKESSRVSRWGPNPAIISRALKSLPVNRAIASAAVNPNLPDVSCRLKQSEPVLIESLAGSNHEARTMSGRSKRKHGQRKDKSQAPLRGRPIPKAMDSPTAGKGRAILIALAIFVLVGVLFAVTAGRRKGAITTASGPKIVFATPVYDFGKVR